jgi:hypothetical protein
MESQQETLSEFRKEVKRDIRTVHARIDRVLTERDKRHAMGRVQWFTKYTLAYIILPILTLIFTGNVENSVRFFRGLQEVIAAVQNHTPRAAAESEAH